MVETDSSARTASGGPWGVELYVRAHRRRLSDGTEAVYACVVESVREGGRHVQRTVINLGRVEESQLPYLRAAWMDEDKRPRLVWD